MHIHGHIATGNGAGFTVPSIDVFVTEISKNGGRVIVPKMLIQGVGYFAYCEDRNGNSYSVLEPFAQETDGVQDRVFPDAA